MKISNVSFKASILEQMQKSITLAQPPQKHTLKSTTNQDDHFEIEQTNQKPKKKNKRKKLKLFFGTILLILIGLLVQGTRSASKLNKSYGDINFKVDL